MTHLSALSLALNRPGAVSLEQVVASLFANNEQGAWYDPSAANVTWRRNLLTYTEQFDNTYWPKENVTIVANAAVAPDGTTTADLAYPTTTGVNRRILINYAATLTPSGIVFTQSVYVKAAGFRWVHFNAIDATSSADSIWFDLQDVTWGTVGADVVDKSIVDVGNGWRRISVTGIGSGASSYFYLMAVDGNGSQIATTNGTNGIYVWGAQLERGSLTAYQRIVTPELTYLADVQAQPLLFQGLVGDFVGATPVTAVEQPVGLILDRRKGLALGSEQVADPEFSNSGAWTAQSSWVVSGGKATYTTGLLEYVESNADVTFTSGKWYKITYTVSGIASGFAIFALFNKSATTNYFGGYVQHNLNGVYSVYYLAATTTTGFRIYGNAGSTAPSFSIENISVKLLDGNHAYQSGSAARPVLRARYNLLTYSEQFDVTTNGWAKQNVTTTANAAVAPDGTTTADKLIINNATAETYYRQSITLTTATNYTLSAYVKAAGVQYVNLAFVYGGSAYAGVQFDLNAGTAGTGQAASAGFSVVSSSITPVSGYAGWYRCTVTMTSGQTSGFPAIIPSNTAWTSGRPEQSLTGNGTDGILAWGADLRVGTSAGDYQRIAASTDYATVSTITGQAFRPYLEQPTGGDDSLIVANSSFNDFAASNAPFFMSAGVTRYGTTRGTIFCLADNTNATAANNDTLNLEADSTAQVRGYLLNYDAGGNTEASATAGTLAAEATFIASWQRTATDGFARNNGTAGTGADQTAPAVVLPLATVFAQRRGTTPTTDQRFTGRMFGLIVRAGAITAGQMSAVETYLAGKSGVTL